MNIEDAIETFNGRPFKFPSYWILNADKYEPNDSLVLVNAMVDKWEEASTNNRITATVKHINEAKGSLSMNLFARMQLKDICPPQAPIKLWMMNIENEY